VVHRDVKPANIFLVAGEARAVLLDFGIAKLHGVPSTEFSTGAHVIGTPRYLAPEQVLGAAVDARTDVYGVGLVLYEALAGRGPFDADGAIEAMRAQVEDEPLRLGHFVHVPAALERAIFRALDKRPEERWPSARAFAAAIRKAGAR
jgi:serine/threonine-protein kinase